MKFVNEFRNPKLVQALIKKVREYSSTPIKLMEVCGTHTVAISKSGLRQVIPNSITLLSGPGCPVCVTSHRDLDRAITLASIPNVIITTFGDMMKVPGSFSSLSKEKASGKDIRVVYSTLDALKIAEENRDKRIIFLGVGFETSAPTVGQAIIEARRRNLKNFFVFSALKTMPLVLKALIDLGEVNFQGYILPGHVSVIIGVKPYQFLSRDYGMPGVIAGFEPLDVLQTILMLVEMIEKGEPEIKIQYKRAVSPEGNLIAQELLKKVFEPSDADWRGIGVIPETGLKIAENYGDFDAERIFKVETPEPVEPKGCRCGEVLRGLIFPYQCGLFAKACTPESPVGPCMVSSEGACAAYYRYNKL